MGSLLAQEQPNPDVSDKEVKQFVAARQQVQQVEMATQQEMVGEVNKEEMELNRFNEIMKAQQDPKAEVAPPTEEEMQKVQKIVKTFEDIQLKAQQKMQQSIEEQGLTVERYQQIMNAVQADNELMQKVQESMQPQQ
jgi:hypothetical protein